MKLLSSVLSFLGYSSWEFLMSQTHGGESMEKEDQVLQEITLQKQSIYEGRVVRLELDTVRLPNGKTAQREIVHHPGAVAILAVTEENRVVLLRQFRKPCEQVLVEIPAGKLEAGEDPLSCAKRELQEETGFTAGTWKLLHRFFTSPGFADEQLHLYMASDLTKGSNHLEEDEFVQLFTANPEEVQRLLTEDQIHDAKTLIALYHWLHKQREK